MALIFKCKHCGRENEISEALAQQMENQVLEAERNKHRLELKEAEERAQSLARKKIKSEFELTIKQLREAEREEKERNEKFQRQILELSGEMRRVRREREDEKIELAKKLAGREEEIRRREAQKAAEENQLKFMEYEKKLADTKKALAAAQAKAQQGSQQTQGEVLELELEEILKKEFPVDNISEIKKGQRGADVIQEVVDRQGRVCGTILWESKNARWSNGWIGKLKEDQRQAKAHLAVLLVSHPPDGLNEFDYRDGVWVAARKMAVPLALALRFDVMRVNYEKLVNTGKNEKMAALYQYATSLEFKHRIEAIVEAFSGMQAEMEREKRWFQTKWARQERQLRKVIDHTHGMYGDLQGVVGRSLPEIVVPQIQPGDKK